MQLSLIQLSENVVLTAMFTHEAEQKICLIGSYKQQHKTSVGLTSKCFMNLHEKLTLLKKNAL
jgi:hypothetical protein